MKSRLCNISLMALAFFSASSECAAQSNWLHDSVGFTEAFRQVNIAASDTNNFVASGYLGGVGQVTKSTDGGTTWNTILNTGISITAMVHPTRSLIILGGVYQNVGYICRSTDGGKIWQTHAVGSSDSFAQYNAIGAIAAFDSTHIFLPIAGDHYLYSSNGGTSWDSCSSPTPIHYNALGLNISNPIAAYLGPNKFLVAEADSFIDGSYAYKVFRSTNLGKTWSVGFQLNHFITKFAFISSKIGFASGFIADPTTNTIATATIDKTIDGGVTWSNLYSKRFPGGPELLSIAFADSLHGIAVGGGGLLIRTSDGGQSWKQDSTDFSPGDLSTLDDIVYPDSTHAIAVCRDGEALIFQPHGRPLLPFPYITYPPYSPPAAPASFTIRWNPVPGASRYSITVSTFPDSVAASDSYVIGTSFNLSNLSDTSPGQFGRQYEIALQAFNDSNASNVAHRSFIVYRGHSVVNVTGGPISQYLYVQTWPNPATERLHVRLAGLYSERGGRLTAAMDDLLGRKVVDLTQQAHQGSNGSYSDFAVDVSALPAGVYMIRYTLGNYSAGRPVVIIH